MKLSEAITLGAMLTPQAVGHFIDARGGRCAWASAIDATGRGQKGWSWTKRTVNCPDCGITNPAVIIVIHLNDTHRWSRHRIAEWISTIEPTEQTSAEGEEFSSVA